METVVQSLAEADASPVDVAARPLPVGAGISIIVPCWRGDAVTDQTAARWLGSGLVSEVLIASADESDPHGTSTLAGLRFLRCSRAGRGIQMNEAARTATGEILLFHHADTELTEEHLRSLAASLDDPTIGGGAFRRRFDERHLRLRWLEPWEARRCHRFGPVFGDQSIFVRRTVFEKLGGFADVPLMEDVEFSCRLRRHTGGLSILVPAIGSSARKHLQQGRWRTTLANALLLALYVFGVSPQRLHAWYYRRRPQGREGGPDAHRAQALRR